MIISKVFQLLFHIKNFACKKTEENEGVVKFRERSDLTILEFIDQDTNNVMGYIAGYALDINFNMEMLNCVEKIESFLEALKSAFRKKVYDIAFKGAK